LPRYALLTYMEAASLWVKSVVFDERTLTAVPGTMLDGPASETDRLRAWSESDGGTCSGPFYNVPYEEWAAWSRPEDRALHVYRDPRDRLISWVCSMSYSHRTYSIAGAMRTPLCSLDLRDRISVGIVATAPAIWMSRTWLNPPEPRNFFSVSFEALVEHPAREFAAIFESFEWTIPSAVLDDVLARRSFEVFSGARARGETNVMHHYRRGVSGNWKNYFDRELGRLFEENYPRALIDMGYETSETWFETLPEANEVLERDESAIAPTDDVVLADIDHLRRRNEALETGFAAQSRLLAEYQAIAGAIAGSL